MIKTQQSMDPEMYCIRCRRWVRITEREAKSVAGTRLVWVCRDCRREDHND